MWTEKDDKEIEYGKWNHCTAADTLAEKDKVHPPGGKGIWPHWSEGIPTKLCIEVMSPVFYLNGVYHKPRFYYQSLELKWRNAYTLSQLKENNHLLPGDYTSEWSGVYRIFSPKTTIDRCCGKDPTGTLYLGLAGSRGRNWSTLRTRISQILTGAHHAMDNRCDLARRKYPSHSLAVEWAYTDRERLNSKGEPFAEAIMAERWLLNCYKDSFGEFPP